MTDISQKIDQIVASIKAKVGEDVHNEAEKADVEVLHAAIDVIAHVLTNLSNIERHLDRIATSAEKAVIPEFLHVVQQVVGGISETKITTEKPHE